MSNKVSVGISNRHIHVSKEHLEILFGKEYELTKFKDLSQPGQYAANEKIDIVGPKGTLKGVRILGPVRKETQIEISLADGFVLGVVPPVRDSGELEGSPGAKIVGLKGEVELERGIIAAARHIHVHTSDAEKLGLTDKQMVSVKVEGKRGLVLDNVMVRVHPEYNFDLHIDLDEGNAAGLKNGDLVEIIK